VISENWAITEAKFGATKTFEVPTSDFGKSIRYFHAVDLNLRGQVHGVTLRVGTSTGRQVTDSCEIVYDSPLRNCQVALPFKTSLSSLVSYVIPRADVQVSGVFRSSPGTELQATARSCPIHRGPSRPMSAGTGSRHSSCHRARVIMPCQRGRGIRAPQTLVRFADR
jgi:hypothetical protein